jgi:DNA-binding NarL/FixJ family response regulator
MPKTKIVMLTKRKVTDAQARLVLKSIRAGVSGFLDITSQNLRIAEILLDIYDGGAAIPRAVVGSLLIELRNPNAMRRSTVIDGDFSRRLTSREWQVIDLLSRGYSTNDIAEYLVVTDATVRSHIAGIKRKLGSKTRDEAIRTLSNAHDNLYTL